jgi:hypothetical protein
MDGIAHHVEAAIQRAGDQAVEGSGLHIDFRNFSIVVTNRMISASSPFHAFDRASCSFPMQFAAANGMFATCAEQRRRA